MRAVATPGRWVWRVSGVVTAAAIAIPAAALITGAGIHSHDVQPQQVVTRTVTVPQPVTSLSVRSYGAPVQITAGPVRHVRITEVISFDSQGGPPSAAPQPVSADGGLPGEPAVELSVSGGRLSLGDPACANSDCFVSFRVTTPASVTATVASQGGSVNLSGIAGANVDSGGGMVQAARIAGPLTVTTDGGPVLLNDVAGPLRADSGGGPLTAQGITARTVTITTGGGGAQVAFTAAPDTVTVSTDGGPAMLFVPGGPYALSAESDGGPQLVGIAIDPAAPRSINVTSSGGPLQIEPSAGR